MRKLPGWIKIRWRRAGLALSGRGGPNIPAFFAPLAKIAPGALIAAGSAGARKLHAVSGNSWAFPLLASLLLAPALAVLGYEMLPEPQKAAASRQVQNVLAMLDRRSPGERAAGELVDVKQALAGAAPSQRALGKIFGPPQQRALGKIFAPPAGFARPGGFAFTPPFQPGTLQPVLLPFSAPRLVSSGPGTGGPGGFGGPGGIGGPGGFGGGLGGPVLVTPPVAAVPEPATWLMMIIAFGLCGSMLRRHRRLQLDRASCEPAF